MTVFECWPLFRSLAHEELSLFNAVVRIDKLILEYELALDGNELSSKDRRRLERSRAAAEGELEALCTLLRQHFNGSREHRFADLASLWSGRMNERRGDDAKEIRPNLLETLLQKELLIPAADLDARMTWSLSEGDRGFQDSGTLEDYRLIYTVLLRRVANLEAALGRWASKRKVSTWHPSVASAATCLERLKVHYHRIIEQAAALRTRNRSRPSARPQAN